MQNGYSIWNAAIARCQIAHNRSAYPYQIKTPPPRLYPFRVSALVNGFTATIQCRDTENSNHAPSATGASTAGKHGVKPPGGHAAIRRWTRIYFASLVAP